MNRRTITKKQRRGMVVLMIVVLMVMIQMAVISSISASGDESRLALLRVQTCRAFYAAEAGGLMASRRAAYTLSVPTAGTTLSFTGSGSTVRFVEVPTTGQAGDILVEGVSGDALRRVRITLN